nr:hypothetical protein [Carnobacterium funditum]
MSAFPFIYTVGIDPTGLLGNLFISLYITQDSFGTATNVSSNNVIALIINKTYHNYILKRTKPVKSKT